MLVGEHEGGGVRGEECGGSSCLGEEGGISVRCNANQSFRFVFADVEGVVAKVVGRYEDLDLGDVELEMGEWRGRFSAEDLKMI